MSRSLLVGVLSFWSVSAALAFSSGPPDNHAGNPNQMANCTECHTTNPLNSGNGALSITSLSTYVPGQTYNLDVHLEDPGQSRWGFELTVMDDQNEQGGTLIAPAGGLVQLSEHAGAEADFLKHTSNGTFPGESSGTWTIQWTAPAAGTNTVTFWIAGNAANNNGNNTGDFIYTILMDVDEASTEVSPQLSTLPNEFSIHSVYPNPFNPSTQILLNVPVSSRVDAVVYDLLGRQVTKLFSGEMASGIHTMSWRPEGPGGTYYLHVTAQNGWSEIRRLVYVK